jgi:hypothetical protein
MQQAALELKQPGEEISIASMEIDDITLCKAATKRGIRESERVDLNVYLKVGGAHVDSSIGILRRACAWHSR